jgi:hypothetical protein
MANTIVGSIFWDRALRRRVGGVREERMTGDRDAEATSRNVHDRPTGVG